MPAPDSTTLPTIRLMSEGGRVRIPVDSGNGNVWRPRASAQRGGFFSTLETLYDYFINDVADPDEALRIDPDFPRKLRMHPVVAAKFRKRQFTVARYPDRIQPNPDATDKELARQVADHCLKVWRAIPNLTHLYAILQEAVIAGGQGVEFSWHREASGVEFPVAWAPVHKTRISFDRLGNLALRTRNNPVWGVYISPDLMSRYGSQYPVLPRGKVIYHQHMPGQARWDQPGEAGYFFYGQGEDVPLFYPVTFDIFATRLWMKFLEKHGIPQAWIWYDDTRSITDEMLRIADSVRGESVVTIPKMAGMGGEAGKEAYYAMEYKDPPKTSHDIFQSFTSQHTKTLISEILLGDADEGGRREGAAGGYADHVSRKDSGPQVLFEYDSGNISNTINEQLLPPIAAARWPNLPREYVPRHTLAPKEEKDRLQEGQILQAAKGLGLDVAKEEAYELLGLRQPGPAEEKISGSPDPMQAGAASGGMPPGAAGAVRNPLAMHGAAAGGPPAPIGQKLDATGGGVSTGDDGGE